MARVVFEKIIKADRKKVFDITTNYENFQKILPQYYPSTRTISVRGNNSLVEEHLILGGQEFVIMAKHVTDEPILHELFIVGGDAKGTHITTRYEQLPNGTKLILEIDWKFKGLKKLGFGKDKIPKEYSKMIDEFTIIAEN